MRDALFGLFVRSGAVFFQILQRAQALIDLAVRVGTKPQDVIRFLFPNEKGVIQIFLQEQLLVPFPQEAPQAARTDSAACAGS